VSAESLRGAESLQTRPQAKSRNSAKLEDGLPTMTEGHFQPKKGRLGD